MWACFIRSSCYLLQNIRQHQGCKEAVQQAFLLRVAAPAAAHAHAIHPARIEAYKARHSPGHFLQHMESVIGTNQAPDTRPSNASVYARIESMQTKKPIRWTERPICSAASS